MLRPRIIPCLLIHKGGLHKTQQFGAPKYVGDPVNAVRIFNEKEVDELMVLDIDASRHGRPPNESLIAQLAAECRMPLCYGGGVKTVEQFERLIGAGVEKVAISSAAIDQPDLIPRAADRVGAQSVVVVIDVRTSGNAREVVIMNGTCATGLEPIAFAKRAQSLGAGEIVVNCVERDGMMIGYDIDLVDSMRSAVDLPVTVLGGAGSLNDLRLLVQRYPIIGAAAGTLFVLKGKHRAVLINYPEREVRDSFLSAHRS